MTPDDRGSEYERDSLDGYAYEVPCIKCGALKWRACTYIWPRGVARDAFWRSIEQQARVDRVGRPTQKPHNERIYAADAVRRRLNYEARRRSAPEPAPAWVRQAATAVRAFDLEEFETLRGWLREHSRILTG